MGGWQFNIKVGCDDLLPGKEANTSKLTAGSKLNIHGFASLEGDPDFNLALSCHRANKIAKLVRTKRPDCTVADTFMHGATPQPQPGAIPDPHPPSSGAWCWSRRSSPLRLSPRRSRSAAPMPPIGW
jgi:hypothetical protein